MVNGAHTVAWYSWVSHIKVYGQLFAPAAVDDNRSIDVDTPVVEELHDCKRQDDCDRDQSHCESKLAPFFKHTRLREYVRNAPVRVLTLTSSIVWAGHKDWRCWV